MGVPWQQQLDQLAFQHRDTVGECIGLGGEHRILDCQFAGHRHVVARLVQFPDHPHDSGKLAVAATYLARRVGISV